MLLSVYRFCEDMVPPPVVCDTQTSLLFDGLVARPAIVVVAECVLTVCTDFLCEYWSQEAGTIVAPCVGADIHVVQEVIDYLPLLTVDQRFDVAVGENFSRLALTLR